ncbi:protein of unknown function [Butyrivibrio proteoclasticus]|uniref:DUF4214 domain-containing protein n=1 Tax=Butyrivibrio proteoclasticus TaxID=43305 RepID=A0A1I5TYZ9_9FIRM|nr:DUF4214 domain-containing protein [Butyrivibrio proteoclasticus]SFP88268.1 protein of unknown function [Butyrivibrio proteoclasticus]
MKKKIICLIISMTLVMSQGITSFAIDNVGELIDSEIEIQEETALPNTESTEDTVNIVTDGAEKSQEAVAESSVEAASAEEASLAGGDASLTEASTEVLEAVTESSEIISAAEGISGDVIDTATGSTTELENKESEEKLKEIYEIEKYDDGVTSFEQESNGSKATANGITSGNWITGSLSASWDEDYYKITVDTKGYINLSFSNTFVDTSSNWSVLLLDDNHTYYRENIQGDNKKTVTSNNYGVSPGTYYIRVTMGSGQYSQIGTASYKVKVDFTPSDSWEYERNGDKDVANPIENGKEKAGCIDNSSDQDYYKLTVYEPGYINISFTNAFVDTSSGWRIVLVDDKRTYYESKIQGDNKGTVTSNNYGVASGTYYVRVEMGSGTYSQIGANTYKVKVDFTPSDSWEYESNGNKGVANPIESGKEKSGCLDNSGDMDYFKISVERDAYISVDFSNDYVNTSSNWKIKLIRDTSSYSNIFEKEVQGTNQGYTNIGKAAVSAGTYYVYVTMGSGSYSSIGAATYRIRVNVFYNDEQVKAFVTRLYETALGRSPEPAGLNDWTNKLMSGEAQAVNVVQGVLCSPEYINKGKSNGEVVNDCYQAMLGRAADSAGYNDWTGRLNNGMSVNAIFAGFVGSKEFANLCASYGIAPGTYQITEERDKNAGVTAFVSRLYTQALGRAYDVDGLNDWCGRINANPSRDNILNVSTNGFFHSQEFTNKNLNNTEFVKVLYRTFLGREYDDAGLADWVGQLDRGENTRDGVINGFANSQEFSNIMAQYGL